MRTFSLALTVFGLCILGFDAIVSGRMGLTPTILCFSYLVGTLALYADRPFWFRTVALIPLVFVAIFGGIL